MSTDPVDFTDLNADFEDKMKTGVLATMGFTSTLVEKVNIGRESFIVEEEKLISDGEYVIRLVLDINGLLDTAGVLPPLNDNLDPTAAKLSYYHIAKFETSIKNFPDSYSDDGTDTGNTLVKQVRTFLSKFFDSSNSLNNIDPVGDVAEASTLVKLDDGKIKTELKPVDIEGYTYLPDEDATPRGDNLGSRLLTTRQIAQVLDAYVALGVDGTNSRCRRVETSTDSTEYILKFGLREGDSIITACEVSDSDAADKNQQYTQILKVMLVQATDGAWSGSQPTLDSTGAQAS